MNKRQAYAAFLVFITLTASIGFFAYIISSRPKGQELVMKPEFKEWTLKNLNVWKMTQDITAINKTSTTWTALYNVFYNSTNQEVNRTIVVALITDYKTELIFGSYNTSYVIQWAIDHSGDYSGNIKLDGGIYSIDHTLTITLTQQPIYLDGNGSMIKLSKDFTGNFVIFVNSSSYVNITNFHINATGLP